MRGRWCLLVRITDHVCLFQVKLKSVGPCVVVGGTGDFRISKASFCQ
jgi:hypothetical protein